MEHPNISPFGFLRTPTLSLQGHPHQAFRRRPPAARHGRTRSAPPPPGDRRRRERAASLNTPSGLGVRPQRHRSHGPGAGPARHWSRTASSASIRTPRTTGVSSAVSPASRASSSSRARVMPGRHSSAGGVSSRPCRTTNTFDDTPSRTWSLSDTYTPSPAPRRSTPPPRQHRLLATRALGLRPALVRRGQQSRFDAPVRARARPGRVRRQSRPSAIPKAARWTVPKAVPGGHERSPPCRRRA